MDNKFPQITSNLFDLMVILHKKIFNPLAMSKEINLTPAQFSVLFYLMKHDNCSVSEAADYLQISKPNMTPILDSLIELNYVSRRRDNRDRRVVRLSLTEEGQNFYEKVREINTGFVEETFKEYSDEQLENLLECSTDLLTNMKQVSGLDEADGLAFIEQSYGSRHRKT